MISILNSNMNIWLVCYRRVTRSCVPNAIWLPRQLTSDEFTCKLCDGVILFGFLTKSPKNFDFFLSSNVWLFFWQHFSLIDKQKKKQIYISFRFKTVLGVRMFAWFSLFMCKYSKALHLAAHIVLFQARQNLNVSSLSIYLCTQKCSTINDNNLNDDFSVPQFLIWWQYNFRLFNIVGINQWKSFGLPLSQGEVGFPMGPIFQPIRSNQQMKSNQIRWIVASLHKCLLSVWAVGIPKAQAHN